MKEISPQFNNNCKSGNVVIDAELTVRDTRLIFETIAQSIGEDTRKANVGGVEYTTTMDRYSSPDIVMLNNKILRVDRIRRSPLSPPNLIYRLDDPTSELAWGNWIELSYQAALNSTIGVTTDATNTVAYIFYQDLTDGHIHQLEFDGTTWTDNGIVLYTTGATTWFFNVAPISPTKLILNCQKYDATYTDINYSNIVYIDLAYDSDLLTAMADDKKILATIFHELDEETGEPQMHFGFDAIEFEGKYHIFTSEINSRRPIYFTYTPDSAGGIASDPLSFLPIDIIEEDIYYKLGGVSEINDRLWATGVLSRAFGKSMHTYSIGPGHWTMGRDMFIFGREEDYAVTLSPAGKLLQIGTKLYYATAYRVCVADMTYMCGYDDETKKTTVGGIINLDIGLASNQRSVMTAMIDHASDTPALRRGASVDLILKCNEAIQNFGSFSIDAIRRDRPTRALELSCSSSAMKKISLWRPDASYDYWSQTKSALDLRSEGASSRAISGLVRGLGEWEGNTDEIWPSSANQDCVLFSTEKSTRSHIAKARFRIGTPETGSYGKVGVVLNYFRETRAVSALRLGLSENEVTEEQLGNNYIGVYYRTDTQHFYVTHVINNVNENTWEITETITPPGPTDNFWIMAMFQEGKYIIRYKVGDAGAWIDVPFDGTNLRYTWHPWNSTDNEGRAGILMGTFCAAASNLDFDDTTPYIPVEDNSAVSIGSVLIAGEEKMLITGKTNITSKISGIYKGVGSSSGYTYDANPWAFYSEGSVSFHNHNFTRLIDNAQNLLCNYHWNGSLDGPTWGLYYLDNGVWQEPRPESDVIAVSITAFVFTPPGPRIANRLVLPYINQANDLPYWEFYGSTSVPVFSSIEIGPHVANTLRVDETHSSYTKIENISRSSFQLETIDIGYMDVLALTMDLPRPIYLDKRAYAFVMTSAPNNTNGGLVFQRVVNNNPQFPVSFCYMSSGIWVKRQIPMTLECRELNFTSTQIPLVNLDQSTDNVRDCTIFYKDQKDIRTRIRERIETDPNPDGSIIYDTRSPTSGFIYYDKEIELYPAYIVTRGYDDTVAKFHPENSIGLHTQYRPVADRFEYYSADMDMRLHDIVSEAAGKAGVATISERAQTTNGQYHRYPESITVDPLLLELEKIGPGVFKENGIVKLTPIGVPLNGIIGLCIRETVPDGYSSGAFSATPTIDDNYILLYFERTDTYEWSFKQSGWYHSTSYILDELKLHDIDLDNKEITISFNYDIVSIWIEGKFIYSHRIDPLFVILSEQSLVPRASSLIAKNPSAHNLVIDVDWLELDDRIDNYIFDMGTNGAAIIADIVKEKRVFFQDDQYGNLRLFRNRWIVNDDDPYKLTVDVRNIDDDVSAATNIMMDGIDIVQDYSEEMIKEDGNIFYYGNLDRPENRHEMEIEITKMLQDARGMKHSYSLYGPLDPRLEPNDVFEAYIDENMTVKEIVAKSISIKISSAPEFDMEIDGYENVQ